jgi:hypothetical protein
MTSLLSARTYGRLAQSLPVEIWLRALGFLSAPAALAVTSAVTRRLAALLTADAHVYWKAACQRAWADKSPRYRLTEERERELKERFDGRWLSAFKFYYIDAQRSWMQLSELRGLDWWFNFTASAGGSQGSLQPVSFRTRQMADGQECTELHMRMYPPMNCVLEAKPVSAGAEKKTCAACGEVPAKQRCSRCKRQWYCSLACQKAHWLQGHRAECDNSPQVKPRQTLEIFQFPMHHITRLPNWEWIVTNDNVTFASVSPGTAQDQLDMDVFEHRERFVSQSI